MHIDWRWIKQRPHFIAEGLSDYYDVTVVYLYSKRFLFDSIINTKKDLKIISAFRLPFYQNKWVYKLNKTYMRLYFRRLIKKYDPDYLWITFPQLYEYIPKSSKCKIIYDCMDLATGFDFSEEFKSKVLELEGELVSDAGFVFASSNYLFRLLDEKYRCGEKLFLIRNAFDGEIIDFLEPKDNFVNFKIGYVGTISKWIDFELIQLTLDEIENIEYHFIGPSELKKVFNNDRIKFYGAVDYKEVYKYVKDFDCLIVPFIVDDKIKSADPGKIYDYINYNKPIISVYYDELDYFSPFIYFYQTDDDLVDILKKLIQNGFENKYSVVERLEFLKNNSWDERLLKIRDFLEINEY